MKTTSIFFLFIAVVMAGCTKIDNENGGGNNWKPNLGDYDPVPLSDFDNDFYKWCVREFDATGDGILQYGEIKKIEKILFYMEGVTLKSLNGIKYFTSLKYLEDYSGATCDLTSLDVSYNTLLDTLILGHQYDLKHLTVGKHPNLKYIGFSDSKIQSLDLSDCSSLQDISVNCCTLNVSGCKALKSIHITEDKLDPQSRDSVLETLLGLNTCSSLESLRATYTKLTSLDISGLKKLKILDKLYEKYSEILRLEARWVSVAVAGPAKYNSKKLDKSDQILEKSHYFYKWFDDLRKQVKNSEEENKETKVKYLHLFLWIRRKENKFFPLIKIKLRRQI